MANDDEDEAYLDGLEILRERIRRGHVRQRGVVSGVVWRAPRSGGLGCNLQELGGGEGRRFTRPCWAFGPYPRWRCPIDGRLAPALWLLYAWGKAWRKSHG